MAVWLLRWSWLNDGSLLALYKSHEGAPMIDMATEIIREAYRPKTLMLKQTSRPMSDIRYAIASSRRFILDASMSEFLAHLATAPFKVAPERYGDVLHSLRRSARLPADKVFVQLDGKAFRRGLLAQPSRLKDQWGEPLCGADEVIPEPCVLLEQVNPETISLTYFCNLPTLNQQIITVPFIILYKTDDSRFPLNQGYDFVAAAITHGVGNIVTETIAVKYLMDFPDREKLQIREHGKILTTTHKLVAELGGLLRYYICFLATLNDMPVLKTEVRPSKGYYARGNYRRYLDHTIMTLQLPRKATMRTLARRLIAMARRRWHTVEPHWRINKKPQGMVCEPSYKHLWSERDEKGHSYCAVCQAQRVWIVLPHGRGDPMLGVVRHNEVHVTHKEL